MPPAPAVGRGRAPAELNDLRVNPDMVASLVLRTLAASGRLTGLQLEARLGIRYETFNQIVEAYVADHLIDLAGYGESASHEGRPVAVRMNHVIATAGRQRAAELAAVNTHYLGPCPVSLDDYLELVKHVAQQQAVPINHDALASALAELELDERVIDDLGSAMASRSSIFLYGPPGNGKSTIARCLAGLMGGPIPVPFAVAIGDEVIRIMDPVYHRPAQTDQPFDRRWRLVERPLVKAGGELQFSQLELTYDRVGRYYESPLQWKANGGLLVIDDFGRQAESPTRLLNRFIVPMEEHVDYLDLAATGHKIEVPFTCQLVFSTNLSPSELVDEAFLRRIPYKVFVGDPSADTYRRIFKQECERNGLSCDGPALSFLLDLYDKGSLYGRRPLRGSHPRQILTGIIDRARYTGQPPKVTKDSIKRAFDSFLNPNFETG
jgi:predicted ATPase with chaperone activity